MVSARTAKTAKTSYADRVLGAFSQIQREHKKHAIHPAALRAQVKKDAQAKKDKLGPNWSHWVGRALTKMGEEGILEPATPNGSVALTSKGKKAINYARRSARQSIGASPGRNEDGLLWKQVVHFSASKRPRRSNNYEEEIFSEDSDEYRTPSKRASPKKRVRLSVQSPGKKLISKMTKAELRAELNSLQKKDLIRTFEREMSPLTDLESDGDEDVTTHTREEIREPDEEVENMRRDLLSARKKTPVTETSADENLRCATAQMNSPTSDHPSASLAGNSGALLSRKRLSGIVRTESGSHIPNISRRPTPAPSSPDTEMEYDERGFTSAGDIDIFLDTASHDNGGTLTNPAGTRATQNGESSPSWRLEMGVPEPAISNLQQRLELDRRDAHIASLNAEINDLQKRVAEDALLVGSKAAELAALEKSMSGRNSALEALVTERDGTIDAMGKQNTTYKAELAALQDSWRRADEMVTMTTEKLATAEALVVNLQAEREGEACQMDIFTKSRDELLRNHESTQAEAEELRAKYSEIQEANGALLTEKCASINEAANLRAEVDQLKAKVNDDTQTLEQASADTQVLREKNGDLERSIARYQAEVVEKQRHSQQLEEQLHDKEHSHAQATAEVATLRISADEKSAELSEAHAKISSLDEDLARTQKERESLKLFLTKMTADLKAEEAKRRQLEEELSDKERDLHAAQADRLQSRLANEALVAEVAAKDDTINRLSGENISVENRLSVAEGCINDLQNKLEMDHVDSSRAISDLEISLASATSDNAATREDMARLLEEKDWLQLTLDSTKVQAEDLGNRLDIERTEKSVAKAGLLAAEAKSQELADELRKVKKAKENDETTIAALKGYFTHLRDSQFKLFDEIGAKVDTA